MSVEPAARLWQRRPWYGVTKQHRSRATWQHIDCSGALGGGTSDRSPKQLAVTQLVRDGDLSDRQLAAFFVEQR